MGKTPERIYLVPNGWTWHRWRITDEDVEYVRADLAASPGGGQEPEPGCSCEWIRTRLGCPMHGRYPEPASTGEEDQP